MVPERWSHSLFALVLASVVSALEFGSSLMRRVVEYGVFLLKQLVKIAVLDDGRPLGALVFDETSRKVSI